MAFTNIELVRKHLQESIRSGGNVENHRAILHGSDPLLLPHAGLIDGSEKVKGTGRIAPVSELVTLENEARSLDRSDLLCESVVVARDRSLTEIYTENVDFVIDYKAGTVRRIAGGAIEYGRTVAVWYCWFTLYGRNVDYLISYQNGELTRIDGGNIADGQIVWVDYMIESGAFADDVIVNAIIEASAQMDGRIDRAAADDAVPLLTIAETYLAVSILTQIRAIDVVQSSALSASSRGGLASELREISNRYRQQFEDIIRPYLKAGARLAGPIRS